MRKYIRWFSLLSFFVLATICFACGAGKEDPVPVEEENIETKYETPVEELLPSSGEAKVQPIAQEDAGELLNDWPEDIHPLRRDVPSDLNPPSAKGCKPVMAKPPEGATVVPVGPFFPVLEEPAYFRLFVEGENIVGGDYRGFYSHRGIEKIADSQLNYNQVPFLAERI